MLHLERVIFIPHFYFADENNDLPRSRACISKYNDIRRICNPVVSRPSSLSCPPLRDGEKCARRGDSEREREREGRVRVGTGESERESDHQSSLDDSVFREARTDSRGASRYIIRPRKDSIP